MAHFKSVNCRSQGQPDIFSFTGRQGGINAAAFVVTRIYAAIFAKFLL
jgi:hypothetical protein